MIENNLKKNNGFFNKTKFKIANFFKRKNKVNKENKKEPKPIILIEKEIEKHKENLAQKKDIKSKYEIRKQILKLIIKKKSILTENNYIKKAYGFLHNYSEDNIYEALSYLKNLPTERLSSKYKNEIYRFKALLYELVEDFSESSKSYKDALKAINDEDTLHEFKDFMERYQELLKWQKNIDEKIILDQLYNVHNTTPIEKLPKSVSMLENLALYYARSPKSRPLGKRYFKEVLKIYKKLYEHDPKQYSCEYVRVLLEGVERFMLTTLLLKEAQKILTDPQTCIEQRVYLSHKLKELRDKSFVKKSKIFKGGF
jgi:hypothetical protein